MAGRRPARHKDVAIFPKKCVAVMPLRPSQLQEHLGYVQRRFEGVGRSLARDGTARGHVGHGQGRRRRPPIRVKEGWLEIYHGVRDTCAGSIYRLGAVLLDAQTPWKIVGRARPAILSPSVEFEFIGNVGNVHLL